MPTPYETALLAHYVSIWKTQPTVHHPEGAIKALRPDFQVLEFSPNRETFDRYVYATSGLSGGKASPGELHIFSSRPDAGLGQLLADLAHATHAAPAFQRGDVHNLGRPWQDQSICTFGLIAEPEFVPPFLYEVPGYGVALHMLLPITDKERAFKVRYGLAELLKQFDKAHLDPTDPARPSVITRV